jgi:hypothetical protein
MVLTRCFNACSDKRFLRSVLTDFATIMILLLLISLFGFIVQSQANTFGGIQNVDQLQQYLASSPENADLLVSNVQTLVFTLFGGGFFVLLLSLLFYSFTRGYLWNKFKNHTLRRKTYWKWNALTLLLLLLFAVYLIPFLIVKMLLGLLLSFISGPVTLAIINEIISLSLLLIFVIFMFAVHYVFAHTYKVWHGIGEGLTLLKKKWSHLWRSYLFAVFLIAIIVIVLTFVSRLFVQPYGYIILASLVFLFYLSWLRLFFLRIFENGSC